MSKPILDVAMSYTRHSSPHFDDQEVLDQVREAFRALIYANGPREPVAELLERHFGTSQPLKKIEAILQAPDTPPPTPRIEPAAESANSLRKKTRPWSTNEDIRLLAGIHRFGVDNWVSVAKFVGNGRSRAQCSQRWVRGLDPRISKDQWSPSDEKRLLDLIKANGIKGWTAIAAAMGNRSDVQCRYHYMQMQRDGKFAGELAAIGAPEKAHSPPIPLPANPMPRLPRNASIPIQPIRPRSFSMHDTDVQAPRPPPVPAPLPPTPGLASPPPAGHRLSRQMRSASQGQIDIPRRGFFDSSPEEADLPVFGGETPDPTAARDWASDFIDGYTETHNDVDPFSGFWEHLWDM